MSSNGLVLVLLGVIFCVSNAGQPRDPLCSDNIEVELIVCDSIDQLPSFCISKHQFHCIELDGLLCTIFGLSFDCDAETFCPDPMHGVESVMDRFYKQYDFRNVAVKANPNNDRNGSLVLSDRFLHTLNLVATQSLTLINLNLTSMPQFSGSLLVEKQRFLKKITISGNSIERLQTRDFFDLPSLISLDLQSNKIQHLSEQAFGKLENLDELNLSNNLLRVIPVFAFFELPSLKTLSIANNQLHLIEPKVPLQFSSLVNLELSSNQLEDMPELSNLSALEFLAMNKNKIKNVRCDRIEPLQKLEIIELNDNRIAQFDCNLDRMPGLYTLLLNRNLFNSLKSGAFFNYLNSGKTLSIKGNLLFCFLCG